MSEAVNPLSTKVWFLCTAKSNHPMTRAWPRWVTSTATARIATGRTSFADAIKGWPHRVTLKNAASAGGITTVHIVPPSAEIPIWTCPDMVHLSDLKNVCRPWLLPEKSSPTQQTGARILPRPAKERPRKRSLHTKKGGGIMPGTMPVTLDAGQEGRRGISSKQ